MPMHRIIALAIGAGTGLALAAPAAAQMTPVGLLVPQPSVVSDYRFEGMSSTKREPTAQFSLYLWRPDKFYAGAFVSGVDYGYPGSPSYEVDGYVGRHFDIAPKTRLTAEVMASTFPDQANLGPTLDFVQTKLKAERTEGRFSAFAQAAYTPNAAASAGRAWTLKAGGAYAVRPWLKLDAAVGRRTAVRGQDRDFWRLGATASGKALALELAYQDTNLSRAKCFNTDWCAPGLVVKLTYTPPANPGR